MLRLMLLILPLLAVVDYNIPKGKPENGIAETINLSLDQTISNLEDKKKRLEELLKGRNTSRKQKFRIEGKLADIDEELTKFKGQLTEVIGVVESFSVDTTRSNRPNEV